MDFTHPFVSMERRRLTDIDLAQVIRLDMAAELDAINLYQAHLESTDNPVAQRVIRHIMEEEKEHLAEFAQLLFHLDVPQAQKAVDAAQAFAATAASPTEPTPDSSVAPSTGFTVGSLKA